MLHAGGAATAVAAVPATVVDTTGAGDALAGALLAGSRRAARRSRRCAARWSTRRPAWARPARCRRYNDPPRGCSSVGRASASQAVGRGFEPHHPLLVGTPCVRRGVSCVSGCATASARRVAPDAHADDGPWARVALGADRRGRHRRRLLRRVPRVLPLVGLHRVAPDRAAHRARARSASGSSARATCTDGGVTRSTGRPGPSAATRTGRRRPAGRRIVTDRAQWALRPARSTAPSGPGTARSPTRDHPIRMMTRTPYWPYVRPTASALCGAE